MRSSWPALLSLFVALTCLSFPGCARDEVRLAPVVSAIQESDRLRRLPIPSPSNFRPLVLYTDVPIADSLADPDSIQWLRLVHVRWDLERYVDRVAHLSPPDSVFEAIRAARDRARIPPTM